ncbi:hypothetical protein SAMN04489747_1321 [Auraticoccus monumenti]|uniref:Uncharacterized protein n=1 Tax=Auraticoccus monumenti TaxID=675864 RepID=A0A1G6W1Z6_9ACTN|nr:hypothetical protein SAMN04489747_1321 [Auraticoccus monumenti]
MPQPGHFLTPRGQDAPAPPPGPPPRSSQQPLVWPSEETRPGAAPLGLEEPRPFALTASAVLTVTAGLQVACLVGFVWLVLWVGSGSLNLQDPLEAGLAHTLNRGSLALSQGLWLPMLGFPLAATVLGFLVLIRTPWTRVALTVLGLGAVAWMAWWRLDQLAWVAVPAGYVTLCVVLLWTPGVSRWLRTRPRPLEDPR